MFCRKGTPAREPFSCGLARTEVNPPIPVPHGGLNPNGLVRLRDRPQVYDVKKEYTQTFSAHARARVLVHAGFLTGNRRLFWARKSRKNAEFRFLFGTFAAATAVNTDGFQLSGAHKRGVFMRYDFCSMFSVFFVRWYSSRLVAKKSLSPPSSRTLMHFSFCRFLSRLRSKNGSKCGRECRFVRPCVKKHCKA